MGLVALLSVDASVISGTNVTFGVEPFPPFMADYRFTLYQNEGATDHTSMWFNFDGATLSFETINIDESSGWYLTTYNEAFTTQTIQNGNHPVFYSSRTDPMNNDLPIEPGPFYLGIQTWRGTNEVFGWALMNNTGSELVMLDNAMAYGAEGIYIGTTQAIPEPTTLALLGAGGLALYATRRIRKPSHQRRGHRRFR